MDNPGLVRDDEDSAGSFPPKLKTSPVEVDVKPKHEGDENKERGNWTNKLDFILSAVGFAVGLGNVWRFPYLCYRNGGGAFLIPYTIMLAVAGLPLFFMELAFGQYASLGPIAIWRIAPLFKGLGYVMLVLSALVAVYYNMILAYTIFYLFASFTSKLPWSDCGNPWNTPYCRVNPGEGAMNCTNITESTSGNVSEICVNLFNFTAGIKPRTPAEEYWENYVLEMTDGVSDLGYTRWQLVLCLLLAWIVVFLCLIKGIKSVGKVVYFTAVFPYVVLTILLIRGVTLPGAGEGIKFYIIPDFKKLTDAKVWGDAAVQIFYSLGPAWGGLITMSSYNKFHNNCYRDAILVATINCATSVYAGFAIFSVIGFMAHTLDLPIQNATASGPGLAFVAYPEGLARMPGAPFWAILFFFMLWTLGLDSMFAMMETIVSSLVDEFPTTLRRRKVWFTLFLCVIFFLMGLVMCTQGGLYILNLMDWYSASYSLMITALLEVIVITHIYGYDRFVGDIESMIGFKPNIYWRATLMQLTPMSIIFIIIFLIINYAPLQLNDYIYPDWANGIGWFLVVFSFAFIPALMIVAIVQDIKRNGWQSLGKSLQRTSKPTEDWGPALPEHWRITERYTQTGDIGSDTDPSNSNVNKSTGLYTNSYDNGAVEVDERF